MKPSVVQTALWHRAVDARDPRFDGVFLVGILSTGIYCRPVCPSRLARRENRRFFRSKAAAGEAGFRPCKRCRPELAPGRASVDAVARLGRVAADRIADGALNGRKLGWLANELGASERHLRRALRRALDVSPRELVRTHRLQAAHRLLEASDEAVTRIAYSSGWQSLRRFNAAFRQVYGVTPSGYRRATSARAPSSPSRPGLAHQG